MHGKSKRLISMMIIIFMISLTGCNKSDKDSLAKGGQEDESNVEGNIDNNGEDNLTGLNNNTENFDDTSIVNTYNYTAKDTDASIGTDTTTIILNDTTAAISGSGASSEGSIITIKKAGTYVISGKLLDGQIIIDASSKDDVRLVFDGVTIYNSNTSPVYTKSADKTIIILNDNTVNTITDSDSYVFEDGEDEPNAAIFSKDDLTITGNGTLNVTGNYNNGIGSKDTLCITSGNIIVTAVNDGLRGRDAVAISGGIFNINAGSDGIQSNNDTDAEKGFIVLDGGTFQIIAGNDGIQAETSLTINGGSYDMITGGGSAFAADRQESFFGGFGGGFRNTDTLTQEENESMKGLKAGTEMVINDGIFVIDSADDSIHSNTDIFISGGVFDLSSGDDGVHADSTLTIHNGDISINKSYEGLEGAIVMINGGRINLLASDDGINAAGGSDENSMMGPMGRDNFFADSNYYIKITGGIVDINAGGDGIDSNGNLYFEGGEIYVSGPTDSANAAIDCDGMIEMNGGTIAATGSAGMLVVPSASSTQPGIVVYYNLTQEAGTTVILKDSSENTIIEFTSSKRYNSVILSDPVLSVGNTYSLYSGDVKLTDITISEMVTLISDNGEEVTGGFGGQNKGGMGGGKNRPR